MKINIIKKTCIGLTLLLGAMSFSGCSVRYENDEETTTLITETETQKELQIFEGTLNLKYTNNAYTEYLSYCAKEFEKKYGIKVKLCLTEPKDNKEYLVEINNDSLKKENVADVYMINNSDLSTAYLAGLAQKVDNVDFINKYFDTTAINACSYNDVVVAYPLSYKTTFLGINSAYARTEDISDIESIKKLSDNTELSAEAGIERIFNCNISDIFMNYGFIGDGIVIGGNCGNDVKKFSVCNEKTKAAAQEYYNLVQYFSLDGSLSYEETLKQFIEGKSILTILSTDSLATLEKSETEFEYLAFPNYSKEKTTMPLSITTALVVNPFSASIEYANKLSAFITNNMASKLYSMSGILSANKNVAASSRKFLGIYESYCKSISKNKLSYGEQVYPLLEIAIHNIVAGEDIEKELKTVDEYMEQQLK